MNPELPVTTTLGNQVYLKVLHAGFPRLTLITVSTVRAEITAHPPIRLAVAPVFHDVAPRELVGVEDKGRIEPRDDGEGDAYGRCFLSVFPTSWWLVPF